MSSCDVGNKNNSNSAHLSFTRLHRFKSIIKIMKFACRLRIFYNNNIIKILLYF